MGLGLRTFVGFLFVLVYEFWIVYEKKYKLKGYTLPLHSLRYSLYKPTTSTKASFHLVYGIETM